MQQPQAGAGVCKKGWPRPPLFLPVLPLSRAGLWLQAVPGHRVGRSINRPYRLARRARASRSRSWVTSQRAFWAKARSTNIWSLPSRQTIVGACGVAGAACTCAQRSKQPSIWPVSGRQALSDGLASVCSSSSRIRSDATQRTAPSCTAVSKGPMLGLANSHASKMALVSSTKAGADAGAVGGSVFKFCCQPCRRACRGIY